MTQEQKENTIIDDKQASAALPADAPAAAVALECPPPPEMSKGEKWYNTLVYSGLNYWMNLGISLVITDIFMHGKGKKFFESGVAKASHSISAATGMKHSNSKWLAEIGLGTFSLNSGGNILLIPTKYLEDYKRPIVHWLNDKLGVDQTAPDGHKETAKEIYIEQEQDPQSWARMVYRRVLGWGSTTTVGLTLDRVLAKKMPFPKMVDGEKITHIPGQKVFTDATVNGVTHILNELPHGANLAASPTFQRYLGYAALDSIYTLMTSKILHATNGAHKEKKPEEIAQMPVPVAAPDETVAKKEKSHTDDIIARRGQQTTSLQLGV